MNQKVKVLIVILLMVMVACQKPVNVLTEEMFTVSAKQQVEIAKKKAESAKINTLFKNIDASSIIFPQEEGNAGDIYWEVLKARGDDSKEENRTVFKQMEVLTEAFNSAFMAGESAKITPNLVDLAKDEAEKLTKLPEVAELEKATKRKGMTLIGGTLAVPENILTIRPMPPNLVKGYSNILLAKALMKEIAGDKAAAESAFQSVIALGQHFAQDANYFHYTTGSSIMLCGSLSIKQFYERANNKEKQQAAEKIEKEIANQLEQLSQLGAVDSDKQAFNILNVLGYLDDGIPTLTSFINTETVPLGLKAKALESFLYGYTFRYVMVERSGKNGDTSEYAAPSDARLQALTQIASSSNKALAQMAANTKKVLEKMKGQTSPERAKYWVQIKGK
jgi:hypothetical protein